MTTLSGKRRRYPGAKPFERNQEDIFFGRQTAIDELYRRISLERLTVLYGKSGDGKSSLINAGIIPKLETEAERAGVEQVDTFVPVKIRFEAYQPGQVGQLSPVEKAIGQLVFAVSPNGRGDAVSSTPPLPFGGGIATKLLPSDRSLWATVKNTQTGEHRLLLIFDQFEELFTYPKAQYEAFGLQLAELLNVLVPMRYVRALEQNPDVLNMEENTRLHRQPKVHVLLAIRSDRLNLLNHLQSQLPNVQKINYELPPLNKTEVREAVLCPALEKGDFASQPFDYTPEARKKIIHSLTDDDRQPIASFQLQILCESIEDKVMARQLTRIDETDVDDPAVLYENYYRIRIARLGNPKDQAAARRLIEDGLILEEENRRLSLYEGQIRKNYPAVTDKVLQQLENDHLLRREPNLQGGYSYELSHDTLVKPIAKFKIERLEEERRREVRKQRLRLIGALCLSALAITAALWSFSQYKKVNSLTTVTNKFFRMMQNAALSSTQQEIDPTLALRIAEYNNEKYKENELMKFNFKKSSTDYENFRYGYYSSQIAQPFDILSVAFSPDGNFLLTSFDDMAKKWNLEGREIQTISTYTKFTNGVSLPIKTVAFSQDGKELLNISPVVYSPDKKLFLIKHDFSAILRTINNANLDVEVRKFDCSAFVLSVAFSPNGKYILTGCWDNTVKLWDINGPQIQTFNGHSAGITSVAFSPDGKYILTGSKDRTAKLWNLKGQEIATFTGHSSSVLSVAFSPEGKYVITGSDDKSAKVWNLQGQEIQTFLGHTSSVSIVTFSPKGHYALTVSGSTAKLWLIDKKNNYRPGCVAYQYSLLELWEAGVQLEPEDLKKIGKDENKGLE